MQARLDYESKTVYYKGEAVQTYVFGEGPKTVFSFPSFPHSGLYYLWFVANYPYYLKQARFITMDFPGWTGYTEKEVFEDGDYDIEEVIKMSQHVMDHYIREYKIKNFSIIGYSFGGALAVRLGSIYKRQLERMALVSTIICSHVIENTSTAKLIRLAMRTRAYTIFKKVLVSKFNNQFKYLLSNTPIPRKYLKQYKDMFNHVDKRILLQSAYALFNLDWTEYLLDLPRDATLVVNSRNEEKYFRREAEYIRRCLKNENSFYIKGAHDDFVLKPNKNTVKKVLHFLVG